MSLSYSGLGLVLRGSPGSGEATRAALHAERDQLLRISTGEPRRDENTLGRNLPVVVDGDRAVRVVNESVVQAIEAPVAV